MSTPTPDSPRRELLLRSAVEARDIDRVVDAFAPDAVIRSPITGRLAFEGHRQIETLFRVLLDAMEDLRYTDELRGEGTAVLVARARVGRAELELADHMRLDPDGRIRELTVFFRPMPAIALAARALGAGLGRRSGRLRGGVIACLAAGMALVIGVGDRIAARLVSPSLRR